jgi:hypothetical protein
MNGIDFTYAAFEDLLDTGLENEYDFLTIREYLRRRADASLPDQFLLLRHDVDRKPRNALAMARIEAEYDITGTYYVRTIGKTFEPDIIQRIEALGHEVGYHYEDLDRAEGDPETAVESFGENLAILRNYVTVDTVCMHGNPLTPHDNRTLWDYTDLDSFDLLGEAYLSLDFTDVTYFSDTGRTWEDGDLKIKDMTVGEHEKHHHARTTFQLMDLLSAEPLDRACFLTHPNRWAGSYPELVVEHAKDTAINVVKRGLNVVS